MSFRRSGRASLVMGNHKGVGGDYEDFDDILEVVGPQGRFQKFLLYAVLSPIIALEPILTLNIIFMLSEPDHWCHVPGRDNETSMEMWKNYTLPRSTGLDGIERYSSCEMYKAYNETTACAYGWDYDKTHYENTIPSEFNWVCDRSQYATNTLTLIAVGNAVGSIFFGYASDTFGRKPIFFLTTLLNSGLRLLSLAIPQYFIPFVISQFLLSTAFPMMYITPCMIAAESSGKDYRAWIYSFTWMIWVFGMASLPFLAWLTRKWLLFGIITSVPGIALMLYWWFMPESPRWLISKGKIAQAEKVVRKIAEDNGNTDRLNKYPLESMLKKLYAIHLIRSENVGFHTLFKTWGLAKNTILVTISWAMNNVVYYGITLNASKLNGNPFMNFFILAIIEVPAGGLGGYLADKIGRRWTQVSFFSCCMITCVAAGAAALHPDYGSVVTGCIMVAKFCVTLTFLVVYMQAAEVLPTQLRSTGSGFASTVACATSISAPYIIYVGQSYAPGPYLILGLMSFIGVVASAFLPETLNQKLPETIEEANDFGKGEKFWSFCPKPSDSPPKNEKKPPA